MNPTGSDRPIRALPSQEHETSPDFLARIRRRIYRRAATSQLASYSWNVPKLILIEMVSLLGHLFTMSGGGGRTRDHEG